MRKLIRIFYIIFILNYSTPTKTFAQWNEVYFDSVYTINSIFCLNADTCFLTLGTFKPPSGKVLKTMNGGITWDTIIPLDTLNDFGPIFFINDTIGFLSGNNRILRTYDGGNTWITYPGPCTEFQVFDFHAFNKDTAIFVGQCLSPDSTAISNDIFLTTDGGITLTPLSLPFSCFSSSINDLNNLYFLNDSVGFAGSDQECIYKTTDRGFTWNKIHEDCDTYTSIAILSVSFYNDTMGWFGGFWGNAPTCLEYTTDGGYTLHDYTALPDRGVTGLAFFPDGNGYVAVNDRIYKTIDNGGTFKEQYLLSYSIKNAYTYFERFFFLNSQVGYVTATHSVLRTANGGGVGIMDISAQNNTIEIYPNPTSNVFHLILNDRMKAVKDICIYDMLGRQVYENFKTNLSDLAIDLSENPTGVYLVKVVCEGKVSVSRIVLM